MNRDLCNQTYNDSIFKPQIILPCCHTFCSKCLGDATKNERPGCGRVITELHTNITVLKFNMREHRVMILF